MYSGRLNQLRQNLKFQSLPNLIVSKRENIHYLTGLIQVHPVSREALLFISPHRLLLYHSPFLIPPHDTASLPMNPNNPLEAALSSFFAQSAMVGFEAHNLTYAESQRFQSALPHSALVPVIDLIENQRLIKDSAETTAIRKACHITSKTMSWIIQHLSVIRNLSSEIQISRLIEQKLYQLGADSIAFPTIVAFDHNSALPHHLPGKTKSKPDSVVLLDFGCQYQGYNSDISRTICLGTPPPRFPQIETSVKAAYTAGLRLLRQHFTVTELTHSGSGQERQRLDSLRVKASDLDLAVRQVIAKAGYGKEYIHSSGHGLGLEVHEQPTINSSNNTPLSPGMVITLEPGIYLPGKFGYRHENTLLLQ